MKQSIHAMWKDMHPDRLSFVDSYFHTYYKEENNKVLMVDGDIQASVQMEVRSLSLHNKNLRASFLYGDVGSSGDSLALVSDLVDTLSNKDLITLIQTDRPHIYESLGFETVVESRIYNMSSSLIPEFALDGILLDPSSQELVQAYNNFTNHFTGFFNRDANDFDLMRRHLRNQKGGIVGLVDDGELKGYACYINHGSYVEVFECIYDRSGTLLRLLSFVSRGVGRIVYHASEAERISKVIPDAKMRKVPVLLARINDQELFERLYHIKIISAYSAFNAFGLPLFNPGL